jgi:hypothetical protein
LVKKKKVAFDYTHTVERERGNVLGYKTTVKIYTVPSLTVQECVG